MKLRPLRPDTGRAREALELVRAYHRIPDRDLRRELLDLIKRLAAGQEGRSAPGRRLR